MAGVLTVNAYKIMEAFSNLRTQEQKGNKQQFVEEPTENVIQFQCTEQGSEDSAPIG